MYQQQYFVPKATGTLTDLLLAFGAASVLGEMVRQHAPGAQVTLADSGVCFVVDTGVPVQERWPDSTRPFDPIRFLAGNRAVPPGDLPLLPVRNVDQEWETFRRYTEQRRLLGEQGLAGPELEQALADNKPSPDWTVATYLGDYRMQAQAIHNNLVEQWHRSSQSHLAVNLRTLLALFADLTADWSAIAQEWRQAVVRSESAPSTPSVTVTASQLFNPHMGKGQNRAKANKLAMGNEDSFWLVEFLKAVGLWKATAPTKATNADLRKTYVLAPRRLEMDFHRRVFDKFRERLWYTGPIKQDIMASLLYAEVLLEQSVEESSLDFFDDGPISNVVTGMGVATYQLLSANSYTTMNLAFLGLPDWMPHVQDAEDARQYIGILQEHRERIRAIDEETSEGYELLQLYRDFLSGNYLAPFYEFCAGYGGYLISALDRSQFYVKPFTETNLRRLLTMVDQQLTPILENEGFRNVARAIRNSTVALVYRSRNERRFDVRYGLGRDLMRRAQYKDDFIQMLADFMHDYNDETLRVHERTKGAARRKLLTTHDIEQVVQLIDQYGSKTICNLLVAYGYARDPRDSSDESSATNENADLLDMTEPAGA